MQIIIECRNEKIALILSMASLITVLMMCRKPPEGLEKELFDRSKNKDGYIWYKNSDKILDRSNASGHSDKK